MAKPGTKAGRPRQGDEQSVTFGGRVKMAMTQRGMDTLLRAAPTLQRRWREHFKGKGISTPDRQMFYQWLAADRPRITPENLFRLSDCLDVNARWLALNDGSPTKPLFPDPDLKRLLDAWNAMKGPAAREELLRAAANILAIQGEPSAAHPFRSKTST